MITSFKQFNESSNKRNIRDIRNDFCEYVDKNYDYSEIWSNHGQDSSFMEFSNNKKEYSSPDWCLDLTRRGNMLVAVVQIKSTVSGKYGNITEFHPKTMKVLDDDPKAFEKIMGWVEKLNINKLA